MKWVWLNPEPTWQWAGLAATFAGTLLALWAALAAQSARTQAKRAVEAAVRLGTLFQIADLLAEVGELEIITTREDLELIEWKAGRVHGRIARFSHDVYDDLNLREREQLTLAREQLVILKTIAAGRKQAVNKLPLIRAAVGEVTVALNAVVGMRTAAIRKGGDHVGST